MADLSDRSDLQPKAAEPATEAYFTRLRAELDFTDEADFANARRGFVAPPANGGRVESRSGSPVWDLGRYDFLAGDAPIDTVNPSLLRMARLNLNAGLFEVVSGVYQVRGLDLANMTIVEGRNGVILIDCMTTVEVARSALELYFEHRGRRPVTALCYTHSHVDHYGGARGVVHEADVEQGRTAVFAPDGFLEAVGGENVLAGNAMTRRAQFQFGGLLRVGPRGQVDAGLGKVTARGRVGLVRPSHIVCQPVESHIVDGIEVQFHLAPGTEAPAEMHLFFPGLKVLNMAENATPLLHNFCPLRGAEVRDPRLWSHYLADAVARFGAKTEVLICQHHWPTWGRENVVEFLERQRDLYKHIHDQAVRLMNHGARPAEIAEALDLPPSLAADWRMRGYYGTVSHNAKAVFQRYLSWYDGHPANLNPLPPQPAAKKYVEYMGGAEAVLERAQRDFDAGEYRWVAQVLYHVLFSDPGNVRARALAADAFEQLGYQAESATWRNAYLYAAQELRDGVIELPPRPVLSPDLLAAVATETLFDFMAVRLDAARATGQRLVIEWQLTDSDEVVSQTLAHETLTQRLSGCEGNADVRVTTTRATFIDLIVGRLTIDSAIESEALVAEGPAARLAGLFDMLDEFELQFDVVAPRIPA